jgi:hypothetical protein
MLAIPHWKGEDMSASRRTNVERCPRDPSCPSVEVGDEPAVGTTQIRSEDLGSMRGKAEQLGRVSNSENRSAMDLWVDLLADIVTAEVLKEAEDAEDSPVPS